MATRRNPLLAVHNVIDPIVRRMPDTYTSPQPPST